jgi:hypothetical protein
MAREERVHGSGAGAAARYVRGPTPTGKRVLKLRVELPNSAVREGFDVDEVRVHIEESVERIIKAAIGLDDSELCEPAANNIYRTTTAAAYRVDYCLGRTGDIHVHAKEEYGWDVTCHWYNLDVYFEEGSE